MIAIIDYKAGNLTSVKYAFDALGVESCITGNPAEIAAAERVVFPGVGAAKSAMSNLESLGLVEAVKNAAQEKPFLGICLGMQILFDETEEDGGVKCLGLVPGKVRRFPNVAGCKIPHMGWNSCLVNSCLVPRDSCFVSQPRHETRGTYYYFVHSYYAPVGEWTAGVTEYAGVEFTSIVKRGNILACQFHPEKSGIAGLELLKGWLSC